MNEVQLIRSQLTAEREHLKEMVSRYAALQAPGSPGTSDDITISYGHYILNSLSKERARSAAHLERSAARSPASADRAAEREAAERLRDILAACESVLTGLHAALDASRTGAAKADIMAPLARCGALASELVEAQIALEALAADRYTVDDWRRVAQVDADSILEERRLRAEVLRHGAASAA